MNAVALRIVLDADRPEAERLEQLARLGAPSLDIARALVPLLNEPLDALSRAAFTLLAAPAAPALAVGVDARGLLAASAVPLDDLVDDGSGFVRACPDLGAAVAVRHATLLLPQLAEEPRWARQGANGVAWLRRLDRRPLLHRLSDDGARALPIYRGGDGVLHGHPPRDRHVGLPLLHVSLRAARLVVAVPTREEPIALDGVAVTRPVELRDGERLSIGGVPVLEIAAIAPPDPTDVDGGGDGPMDLA
jgi:hypothetical protein